MQCVNPQPTNIAAHMKASTIPQQKWRNAELT